MPASETLTSTTVDTPVGCLRLIAGADGLRAVLWPIEGTPSGASCAVPGDHPVLTMAAEQLEEYFAGTRTEFTVPLAPVGTTFQLAAWTALRSIPFGETISYAEQARRVGAVRAVRAIGAANGRNPLSIVVPCHRVIGANGSLTGFGGGLEAKAWLLDHERRVRSMASHAH